MNISTTETPKIPIDYLKRVGLLSPTLVLAGIFLLGLALRLNCLDCYSLWYDEVASVETAQRGIDAIFTYRFGWLGNQTPMHYLLVWLTAQVVDPAVDGTFVRLPSALAGALTPLLVYGLGRELFGKAEGLLGALMVALSMTSLDYSQDLRPYAMLTMLTCLSVYCLLLAARTQKDGWWLAFTLATIANMYNSYVAITMALPPLVLMLLWLTLWLWREMSEFGKSMLYAGISLLIFGLAGVPLLLDMLQVPRSIVNLDRLSFVSTVSHLIALTNWYTGFELDSRFAAFASTAALVVAIFGAYSGIRAGVRRGVAVCSLFVLVPLLTISLLSTSNLVMQRYVLFGLPFYFLLISHALISFSTLSGARGGFIKLVPIMLAIFAFGLGAYNYTTIDKVDSMPFRADFRAATRYLSENTGPDDVIISMGDFSLDPTVSDFYWHGSPPSPVYDARDPRLARHEQRGSVYWVVTRPSPEWLEFLSAPDQGWFHVQPFRGGVVLTEKSPNVSMLESLERMAEKNEAIEPHQEFTITLRGCVYQARCDVTQAVSAYESNAGKFFTGGDEYLRTAKGFSAMGEPEKAWREALISKVMQPYKPEVHEWLAEKLHESGYEAESHVEALIAKALEERSHIK